MIRKLFATERQKAASGGSAQIKVFPTERQQAVFAAKAQLDGVDRCCFVHMPRTGGSALLDFLFANVGRNRVLDTFVEAKRFSIFAELRDSGAFAREFATHRFVHIHVPVDLQTYVRDERVAYFSTLRHPFDRIISYYEWCLKIYRETGDTRFGCLPDVSLEDFIEAKLDDVSVFNIYTYFFACLLDGNVVKHDVWRSLITAPVEHAYQVALEALSSFYLVAPLEHLGSAAAILSEVHSEEFEAHRRTTGAAELIPLRDMQRSGDVVVARHQRALSLRAVDLMMRASSHDLMLYEYCVNRFYRQWAAFLDSDGAAA
ncbi:sulfotransferase family 2 domain-containing protein [Trinickia acidisoli]|uniref:sulfotransferase family 2 domain-containing protein n=1 Tax=Trinickia acidisoli TaxID=2767482 RepID=UPI001A8E2428|nr:sulfotransferase family 2 domain-containing protein [Trinickia acidisoli]